MRETERPFSRSFMQKCRSAALLLLCALCPALGLAVGPPNPAESVLVIYTTADTQPSPCPACYSVTFKNAFVAALSAVVPAPTITQLAIPTGHFGIYNDLHALPGAPTDLSQWCQVWDLRFRSDQGNAPYTGPNKEDVITFAGANNDTLLYTNYLNQNGHLFLEGEHHDFYIRDQNLFALINAVASVPLNNVAMPYASYNSMNTGAIGGFPAVPSTFNTSFNNIAAGTISAAFPGGLDKVYAGSGEPIGANFTDQAGDGSMSGKAANTAFVWMSSDLNTSGGRMVVNFETNAFVAPQTNATSDGWIQNVYQLLSGCYKYSLTKAFTQPQLCVGDPGSFTLCYNNAGSTTLTNVPLWDTIPSCLSYVSDNLGGPGPGVNGQVYSWNIPSIAPLASACFTVNFTVNSFACP
jgi:uncharacterized repeat protein (TIGR01451 family)